MRLMSDRKYLNNSEFYILLIEFLELNDNIKEREIAEQNAGEDL